MLKYVREQLAKQGVFAEAAVDNNDNLDDDMFVEAAHVLDELSAVSTEGAEEPDTVRSIRGISIPVQEDFDIELDTVEFCMADSRMSDVPADAALQEAYYNDLKRFGDFYEEACNSTTMLPRESVEAYEDRVFEKQNRLYNEYMETIVQEGLFGFGEIKISDSDVIWRIHINFGKLRENGGEEYNVALPVLYQTKNNKILKKQLDCVKYFDYCKIGNAREAICKYAEDKGIKMPKDGNIWDIITPNAVFIPREQNDKYTMIIRYKNSAVGEDIYFEVSATIRPKASSVQGKSADTDVTDVKDIKLDMKRTSKSVSGYTDQQASNKTVTESHMPSRWGNDYYQEAINFGGGEAPPEMAGSQAAPTSDVPPAPAAPAPQPEQNNAQPAQPAETNINIDLPPEEGQGGTDTTTDNNSPADPPAPENPNVNDVSDQIAAGVNEELEKQNTDGIDFDGTSDPDAEPDFSMDNSTEPAMDDMATNDVSSDINVDNADMDTPELDTSIEDDGSTDIDFDKMTLNQLIEQAQEKAKDMTIDQLKAFLMDNTMPNGEEVGAGAPEEGVQEAFIYTKSNINSSMDVLLRDALGILNDQNLELSELIRKFKKTGKKLNKCLTKAGKMTVVYVEEERTQINLLNRCLVDLMSMVKASSSDSNTQTAKRLVKAFVSQAKAVGAIIDKHKNEKPVQESDEFDEFEDFTQEGAITALFNVRENLERKAQYVQKNVTGPIKRKVDADKLTIGYIKETFKTSKQTVSSGSAYGSGYGAYGTTVSREYEHDNPRTARLNALRALGEKIEAKDRKRAKFSEEELKYLDRTTSLASELYDDIKSCLKLDIESDATKLLKAIAEEAIELNELCKKFHK